MTDRKTITITEDCYELLDAEKHDHESWTDVLTRLTTTETPGGQAEHDLNALTEDHIHDIAHETAQRTADEVENRLTRR